MAYVKRLSALAASLMLISACSSEPEIIDNARINNPGPSSVVSEEPEPVDGETFAEPIGDTSVIANRLAECVNGSTDFSTEGVSLQASECFFSHTRHLGDIFALRAVGEVNTPTITIEDESLRLVKADFTGPGDEETLSIRCYWVEEVEQCKVIGSALTDVAEMMISPSVRDEFERSIAL